MSHLKCLVETGMPPNMISNPLLDTEPTLVRMELTPNTEGTFCHINRSLVFLL